MPTKPLKTNIAEVYANLRHFQNIIESFYILKAPYIMEAALLLHLAMKHIIENIVKPQRIETIPVILPLIDKDLALISYKEIHFIKIMDQRSGNPTIVSIL